MGQHTSVREPGRALALDALRGLAILMMCLSGLVPEGLPNWMYHGYYPRFLPDAEGVWHAVADPYTHRWQWSSFTWVDWVFPMFLFAMGAAFPLALGRRLDRGVSVGRLVMGVVGRGLSLIGFAIYVRQIVPSFIEQPASPGTWCLGLVGFALLFPVLTRLPSRWTQGAKCFTRLLGLVLVVGFVVYLNRGDGKSFSYADNDIIILLLAHMALAGSLIWLITRHHPRVRLVFLILAYLAHDKAMYVPGDPVRDTLLNGASWIDPFITWPKQVLDLRWLNDLLSVGLPDGVLNLSPLYDFTWYKFLFIVIPGTILGDLIRQRMKASDSSDHGTVQPAHGGRYGWLVFVLVGLILSVLVGLHCYGRTLASLGRFELVTPWVTWLGVVPFGLIVLWASGGAGKTSLGSVRVMVLWGLFWLVLGLMADPFEVGITKGPPATLSYYFVSLGLSVLLLSLLTILIDELGYVRMFGLLTANGQNPMLAYVGIRNLLAPLVMLPLLRPLAGHFQWITGESLNAFVINLLPEAPWYQFVWAVVQTMLLAVIVAGFTRCRVIWRA